MSDQPQPAHVYFRLREPVEGGYRYTSVQLRTFHGGPLVTSLVPSVGDVVFLYDPDRIADTAVVVGREWHFSSYGSVNWPYGQSHSNVGPSIDVFVEKHPGWYADEVPEPDEES